MVAFLFFTKDNCSALARSLGPLVHDAIDGHVTQVIVVDADSGDATQEIADATGCDFHHAGKSALRDIVADARADWLIVMEPGARLRSGWFDGVMDHVMRGESAAARFAYRPAGSWFGRVFRPSKIRSGPLSRGLLISKAQALANLGPNAKTGEDMARGLAMRQLNAEIEPAGLAG
jgi:hypothetical protein